MLANCFNIAVAGSLVAYAVYRLTARGAALTARRRVVAAALAGYLAINTFARLTGMEMGVQPLLFKGAGGAPLYAPYPVHIAVPAVLIGHLTFASLAEMLVSAGLVAYFQRTNPSLLELTAPLRLRATAPATCQGGWRGARRLSPRLLWSKTKAGEIPCVRIGKCVRYRLSGLEAWIDAQEQRGALDV